MNPVDLITAGVGIVNELIRLHHMDGWFKLIFGFCFTFVTTFSMACGTSLIGRSTYGVAIGYGLIAAAGAITALFVMSPQTKGIMVVQDQKNMPGVDLSQYQSMEKTK